MVRIGPRWIEPPAGAKNWKNPPPFFSKNKGEMDQRGGQNTITIEHDKGLNFQIHPMIHQYLGKEVHDWFI